jgi:hypothetical protein
VTSIQLGGPSGRGRVNIRPGDVYAMGSIMPRLQITLHASTTREKRWADIHLLRGKLSFGNEQIAEGFLSGVRLSAYERSMNFEVPIARGALQHVADHAVGDWIDLTLDLSGWLEVHREPTEDDPTYFGEVPEPGERGFITFGEGRTATLRFQIARSDWFTRVMQPVGTLDYVVTEIPLLKGTAGAAFAPALNHLKEAEGRYATGDSAEVFFRWRAAVEALPGAPKNIFDPVADRDLAECMNAVMKETVDYLHAVGTLSKRVSSEESSRSTTAMPALQSPSPGC